MEFPNGTYAAKTVNRTLTETKNQIPQVAIKFELKEQGFEGKHLTYFGVFTGGAFEHTAEALRASGWTGHDLTDLGGELLPVSLVVENEEFNGQNYVKVRWVNSPGGITAKPMDPNAAKSFAMQMKARFLAFDQESGKPPASRPPAARGGGPTNDDIPF
jgi:hypothetical protein